MATAVLLTICTAGVIFLIRFFVALCQEEKAGWRCFMVSVRSQSGTEARPPRSLPLVLGGRARAPRPGEKEVLLRRQIQPFVLEVPVGNDEEYVAHAR